MKKIADLHIHSKYSRATSPQMNVEVLDLWARKKGIDILATGDFTHPAYLKELKENLVEDGSGLLTLERSTNQPVNQSTKFILSAEIACIYKDKDKVRRLHICVYAPDFATVDKINCELEERKSNLRSDGRPIIGMSAKDLAKICFDANEKTLVVPAHAWTPWFAIFGSKSGYDSMEECFEELTPKIYAIETGLSSDPEMNWRLSVLDDIMLISNSDAHSPKNLGREANVFDLEEVTYDEIYNILKNKDRKKFLYTIEFYPQEGMYHFDGHRDCSFSCSPQESKEKHKDTCPVCKKPLVLGVDHRVEELADRELGFQPDNVVPYKSLVPLQEIIAECMQRGKNTKGVESYYEGMIEKGESEFNILLNLNRDEIKNISNEMIAEAIDRVRKGKVIATPGFDGQYGVVKVFTEDEIDKYNPKQNKLF
ncbi:DNA helicase UvrD [Candidatus Falkowbacteria bacterium]|nr:DNA helicase UvrD [Candidatus Falkowbacteria bacterium]